MNKKGFTLIEIIVCIALLALIGVGSIVGIRNVSRNIKISKLEQIQDKIIAAAEVYIETNKETRSQLYEKNNGVVIPLNVLVNEGLLSLENTDLDKNDIKDEYVITALSNDSKSTVEDCIDIRTETSWKKTSDSPIYICTKIDNQEELEKIKNELNKKIDDLTTSNNASINSIIQENQTLKEQIKSYEDRLNSLDESIKLLNESYDYVLFDVGTDTSKWAYWPDNTDQDLWKIVSNKSNKIKLLYNQNVMANNSKAFEHINLMKSPVKSKCDLNDEFFNMTITDYYELNTDLNNICSTAYNLSNINYKTLYVHNDSIVSIGSSTGNFNFRETGENKICNGKTISIKNATQFDIKCGNGSSGCKGHKYWYNYNLNATQYINSLYKKPHSSYNAGLSGDNFIKYKSNEEWSYYDMFTLKTSDAGSKKKELYNQINNNLKNYIKDENYYYIYDSYRYENALTDMQLDTQHSYKDKLGNLNLNEMENIKTKEPTFFSGMNFSIGGVDVDYSMTYDNGGGIHLLETQSGNWLYPTNDKTPFKQEYSCYTNASKNGKTYKYDIYTSKYSPVITLQNGKLLTKISEYPQSYKNKRTSCNDDNLGTRECPRLIKFNNYYSDGTKI